MQVKSLVLGAALAFQATTAVADSGKPKIYFPRHVKRQFTNLTTTSPESLPESTSFTSSTDTSTFSSVLSSLRQQSRSEISSVSERDTSQLDTRQVTTIIVSSTIRVSPTSSPQTPSLFSSTSTDSDSTTEAQEDSSSSERDDTTSPTGLLPPIVLFPSDSSSEEGEPASSAASSANGGSGSSGIVIGPSGIVGSTTSTSSTSTTSTSSTSTSSTSTAEPTTTGTTTTRGLVDDVLDPIVSAVSEIVPGPSNNETETSTEASELPSDLPDVTSATTTTPPVTTTTTSPTTTPTSTSTSTDGGLDLSDLLPIPSSLPSLLPPPPTTTNSTESDLPASSDPPAPPESSTTGGSDTTVIPSDTTLPPQPSSQPSESSLPPVDPSVLPPEPSLPPNTTDSSIPSQTGSPIPSSDPGSIGNDTSTPISDLPEPTAPPSVSSTISGGAGSETSQASEASEVVVSASTPPVPAPSSVETSQSAPPETWMPTTIIVEHSTPTNRPTSGASPTTDGTQASDLPRVIGPDDASDLTQPKGTVLLQVGFLYAENYEFVSNNPMAAAQLFEYLPEALAWGGKIDRKKIKVTRLVPFDTSESLGYITTLARFWYPETMINQLQVDVQIPNSNLYNNPSELIFNLTKNINPAINIFPGMEGDPDGSGDDSGSNGDGNGDDDMLGNNESDSTPMQSLTAAAIGLGSVGLAAAYGAAMFLLARRYKRKKQAHRRASSLANSSEMRYTGAGSPALMGGALLSRDFSGYGGVAGGRDSHGSGRSGAANSARTAQISAPVAAENSLGWN